MIKTLIGFLTIELTVLLTAAMPIIEMRGAIPVGMSYGLSPLHATLLSLLGSMIPVPIILFSIRPIFNAMKRTETFKHLAEKLTHKSMDKHAYKIKKYGFWGLVLVVAIPLPGTGVWSGSLAAALMDMRFKWAFPAIFLGNLIAAVLIVYLSKGVMGIMNFPL